MRIVKLSRLDADAASMARLKVGEILIRAGLIDEMQLRAALGDQSNWGQRLGVTLVKMGLLEERDLVRALAQQLQLPVVDLEGKRVQPEVLELVPVEFAEKHLCVPLFVKEHGGVRTLHVGMDDPCDLEVLDDLEFRTGLKVQAVLVSPSGLWEAIDRLYRRPVDRAISLSGGAAGPDTPTAGVDTAPEVQESLFREVSAFEPSEPASEQEPEHFADGADAWDASEASEGTNRTILRALCHLLIEKQVIGRDELRALIRSLEGCDPRA